MSASNDLPFEISVAELRGRLADGESVPLIDVRMQHEWDAGHIEGAALITLTDLDSAIDRIPSGEFVLYCHVGQRSAYAAAVLRSRGFEGARSLAGGIDAWDAFRY